MDLEEIGLEQHALIIAWLAQETIQRYGERGEAAIREGVRRYGRERGRRMAARARAAGKPLDVIGFLAFGEIDTSGNTWKVARTAPFLEMQALQCAWHDAWEKHHLLDAGRFYCLEVDDAIMHGFDPDFRFQVEGTLSNGAPLCRFLYYGGKMNYWNQLRLAWYKRQAGNRCRRPFAFHVLHYYRTLARTLRDAFGMDGEIIGARCAAKFKDEFGVSMEEIEAVWGGEL